MNLKHVVAVMSVLGMVSCPMLASAKTKHHHKMVKQEAAAPAEYKDYKDMPVACTISPNSLTMTEMTQNVGRALPNPCNPGWYNRIQVSGGLNVDFGKFGNRNANYMGENYAVFSLNDAYVNVSANVNDWANAFASISYNTATIANNNGFPSVYKNMGAAEYSAAYSNNIGGAANSAVQVEQAYLTLGNFNESPIFVQAGKQFQDFGRYEIHPITRTMTASMSETLATSLKAGFLANGFNGSIYAFTTPVAKVNGGTSNPTDYGIALGYDMPSDTLGWDIGAAYLYNLIGVNDVAWNVINNNRANDYNSNVGGVAAYFDVNSGPFTLGLRYVTAVQKFNARDLPKHGIADYTTGSMAGPGGGVLVASATGAQPWAAGINAGYGFQGWNRNQNVWLGYQATNEAAGLNLPKNRFSAGYGIDVWQFANVGVEWDHDTAYSTGNGGSNNNSNLVSFRAAVKYS